jgi:hypothetical protein
MLIILPITNEPTGDQQALRALSGKQDYRVRNKGIADSAVPAENQELTESLITASFDKQPATSQLNQQTE